MKGIPSSRRMRTAKRRSFARLLPTRFLGFGAIGSDIPKCTQAIRLTATRTFPGSFRSNHCPGDCTSQEKIQCIGSGRPATPGPLRGDISHKLETCLLVFLQLGKAPHANDSVSIEAELKSLRSPPRNMGHPRGARRQAAKSRRRQ